MESHRGPRLIGCWRATFQVLVQINLTPSRHRTRSACPRVGGRAESSKGKQSRAALRRYSAQTPLIEQVCCQSFGSISFMAVILVHSTAYNDVTHLLNVSRLMLLSICFRIQIYIIDPSGAL